MAITTIDIPLTGGVNLLADPRRIRDDEVVHAKNLVPVQPGVLATRPAISAELGNTFVTPLSALRAPWPTGGIPAAVRSGLGHGLLDFQNAGINALLLSGVSERPWMVAFLGKVYILPALPADPPAYTLSRDDLTFQSFTFAGSGNADIRPRLAVPYRSRMVWAHFGPGYENTLVFSNNFDASTVGNDVLASNGRAVNLVAAADGDEIIAMVDVMLTDIGAPAQAGLLVLRRYDSFLITGEPDQTTGGTNSLLVNQMSIAAGCISPWSTAKTPHGVIWAGHDEIWLFATGSVPRPIGTKIRPALRRVPRAVDHRVSATYFDGFYRIMLYGEGQSPIDEAAPLEDQWWLDLREGAPADPGAARWWGPQVFKIPATAGVAAPGTRLFFQEARPGFEPGLFGVEQMNFNQNLLVRYGASSARDSVGSTTSIGTVGDTGIVIDLRTKQYDFGKPAHEKMLDGVDLNVWNNIPGRLHISGMVDGGHRTETMEIDVTPRGFELGVSELDENTMSKVPMAVGEGPIARPSGTTVQLRVQGQSGLLIDENNDIFCFQFDPTGFQGYTTFVVELAHGLYSSTTALLAYIEEQVEAAVSINGFEPWTFLYNTTTGIVSIGPTTPAALWNVPLGDTLGGAVTQAQSDSMLRLMARFGFSTGVNLYEDQNVISGVGAVYNYQTPMWEINGLSTNIELIPRSAP